MDVCLVALHFPSLSIRYAPSDHVEIERFNQLEAHFLAGREWLVGVGECD
jgi:hypothetical protein